MDLSLTKRPSAYVPVVMSFAALAIVLGYVALYGIQKSEDEGAAAHIYQLLMVLQVPIILFFAGKYLPREPRQTAIVLTMQLGAACAAIGTLLWFDL